MATTYDSSGLGNRPQAEFATGAELAPGLLKRISWGGVIAGVIIAIAMQMLFTMLGLGLGMTTLDPVAANSPSGAAFGIGAAIWWLVTSLIAMGVGGYVAARLANVADKQDGLWHGLLTWAAAILLSAYLVTTAIGSMLGGAASMLGSTVSGATQAVTQAAPQMAQAAGVTPDVIQQQVDSLLQPASGAPTDPEAMRRDLMNSLREIAMGGGDVSAAKERATAVIAQQAGISPEEATQRLNDLEKRATDAKVQAETAARQAADTASSAVAQGSLWTFVGLVLAAIAAAIGGRSGTPEHRYVTTRPV